MSDCITHHICDCMKAQLDAVTQERDLLNKLNIENLQHYRAEVKGLSRKVKTTEQQLDALRSVLTREKLARVVEVQMRIDDTKWLLDTPRNVADAILALPEVQAVVEP